MRNKPPVKLIGLVKARARSFSNTTGIPYNDLESEAMLAYVHATRSYNASKGASRSTWVYVCVTNALTTYCKTEQIRRFHEVGMDDLPEMITWDETLDKLIFQERMDRLSTDAQEIVRLILHAPEEVVGLLAEKTPGAIRSRLRYHMQNTLGWGWHRTWTVTNELKTLVRT